MIIELLSVLAVLNATIPGQSIPIEVIPRLVDESTGGQAEPVAEATTTGLDIAALTGLVGLGVAVFQGYRKNVSRTDATADTAVNLSQSLKATDKGTSDTASILSNALQQLSGVSPEIAKALENCKPAAVANAQEWKKDMKQYYENEAPLKSEDIGLDKVKTKLKEVNKITQPTPNTDDGD